MSIPLPSTYGSPSLFAQINFSSGPGFSPTFILGESRLGQAALGTESSVIVDVSAQVVSCSIRRTYARTTETWNPGIATLVIADENGDFNPDNTSSPYYGLIKPMRKLTLGAVQPGGGIIFIDPPVPDPRLTPDTLGIFRGYIQSWSYTPANGADVARMEIQATDGFMLFNNANIETVTGAVAGELTGARISKILDSVGWPSTMRTIDTGRTTLQADPGTVRSVLSALQTVEESEYGGLYMDRLGYATFKDRYSLVDAMADPPRIFSDTDTFPNPDFDSYYEYSGVTFALDDELIQNAATVQPAGMNAQYAEDAASIATYFTHSVYRPNLLMNTETDALEQANAIVKARAYDQLRIDSVTANISYGPTSYVLAVCLLEMLENVRIVRTAPGGTIDQTMLVHGITHDIRPGRWITTFQTLEPVIQGFVLGSRYSGVLGVNVLGPY